MTKEAMLPHTGTWTINEAILAAGQATADNLAPNFSQIQYSSRCPTLEMQERVFAVLDNNADNVARITHCTVRKEWVTKTRPGLPNHALAALAYGNLALGGTPRWGEEAKRFGREIQKNLKLEPMEDPIHAAMTALTTPEEDEARLRAIRPGRRTTRPTTTLNTHGNVRPRTSMSGAQCSQRLGRAINIQPGCGTRSGVFPRRSIPQCRRPRASSPAAWSTS